MSSVSLSLSGMESIQKSLQARFLAGEMVRSDPHWILAMPVSKSQSVDYPLFACKYLNFRSHLSNTDPPVPFWPCTFAIRRLSIIWHSPSVRPGFYNASEQPLMVAHVWIMSLQLIHKGNLDTFLVVSRSSYFRYLSLYLW